MALERKAGQEHRSGGQKKKKKKQVKEGEVGKKGSTSNGGTTFAVACRESRRSPDRRCDRYTLFRGSPSAALRHATLRRGAEDARATERRRSPAAALPSVHVPAPSTELPRKEKKLPPGSVQPCGGSPFTASAPWHGFSSGDEGSGADLPVAAFSPHRTTPRGNQYARLPQAFPSPSPLERFFTALSLDPALPLSLSLSLFRPLSLPPPSPTPTSVYAPAI